MDELQKMQPKLTRLKLSGMLDTLEERMTQAIKEKWSHSLFLETLLNDEVERRENKQTFRRTSRGGLDNEKTFETFDFTFNKKIHEPTLNELATCGFIKRNESVFLLGPSGVGKSHLAQAIGHEACRRGYDTLFRRTFTLMEWIHAGKGDGSYEKRIQQTIKTPLLILDDFGLKPLSKEQQADLYEIICERYEKSPIIMTSNRDFSEWPEIFSNPLMASAAMDRLIHRGIKIVIEGNSYRRENFIKRSKELTATLKK